MSALKIGFIGLGRMGRPMVSNLQRKGFATLSFDVNPQAVAALAALGGVGATSVKEVARQSNIIFTTLAASPEVRSVVIDGIVPSGKPGTFVADMSTIDPLLTDEVAAAIQPLGLVSSMHQSAGWLLMRTVANACLYGRGVGPTISSV